MAYLGAIVNIILYYLCIWCSLSLLELLDLQQAGIKQNARYVTDNSAVNLGFIDIIGLLTFSIILD